MKIQYSRDADILIIKLREGIKPAANSTRTTGRIRLPRH
jgi:uncharacterized protein YuzE